MYESVGTDITTGAFPHPQFLLAGLIGHLAGCPKVATMVPETIFAIRLRGES
jgi:hypothetical protein